MKRKRSCFDPRECRLSDNTSLSLSLFPSLSAFGRPEHFHAKGSEHRGERLQSHAIDKKAGSVRGEARRIRRWISSRSFFARFQCYDTEFHWVNNERINNGGEKKEGGEIFGSAHVAALPIYRPLFYWPLFSFPKISAPAFDLLFYVYKIEFKKNQAVTYKPPCLQNYH